MDRTNETELTRSELGYTNAVRPTGGLLHLEARVYDTEKKGVRVGGRRGPAEDHIPHMGPAVRFEPGYAPRVIPEETP